MASATAQSSSLRVEIPSQIMVVMPVSETLPGPSEMNLLPIGTIIRAVQREMRATTTVFLRLRLVVDFLRMEKGIYDDQWVGESILVADDNGQKVWSRSSQAPPLLRRGVYT